jgi:outer membrane lipoprotein-sorting protein
MLKSLAKFTCGTLLALSVAGSALAAGPSALELLQEADRARGAAKDGITWDIVVETFEEGGGSKVSYTVKVKGDDALAEATAPARNKGEMMLFNDRNLWFFKPGIKKPVSISARQKLMGQAANGDIASTQYARDYDATIAGEEKVDGKDTYKLELKAKAKNVTYDRIRYWISKDGKLGVKAEFLTVSGEIFKWATFEYDNKMTLGGRTYPFVSTMTIFDAIVKTNKTVIKYQVPRGEAHSDSLFNVNNLVR